jgi:outer membrane protease
MKWNAYLYFPESPGKYLYMNTYGFDATSVEEAWKVAQRRSCSSTVIAIDTYEDFLKHIKIRDSTNMSQFYSEVRERLKWLIENEPEKVNSTEVYKSVFQ